MCSGRVDVGGGVGLWVGGDKASGGAKRSMGVDDDGRLDYGGSGGDLWFNSLNWRSCKNM